jgi:XTP/dITP diphosphohydrolase
MRIVLASQNTGKLAELQAMLADLPVTLESQGEHGVPSAPETGATFVENAIIKARAVAAATGLAALADDSGLVVPALNGAPGIYSARYAGTHGDDAANNRKLVAELRGINNRQAYFYCAMVFLQHAEDPTPIIATAAWHGTIVDHAVGNNGFGYDPHFFLPELGKTSAQLPATVKNQMSHRGQATAKLTDQLAQLA